MIPNNPMLGEIQTEGEAKISKVSSRAETQIT